MSQRSVSCYLESKKKRAIKKKNKPLGFFSKRKLSNRLPVSVESKDTKPSTNNSTPDLKKVWYKVHKLLANNKTWGNISSPDECEEDDETNGRCPCKDTWTDPKVDAYVNKESLKSQVN